ncbi:MAG: putative peptidyl-prolyl cis-trans isomerase [Candidatus Marinimicrobia bacterium]|nr:putative peptidyl-prolyl cis-trans isomerase [Candidatus Neomarinimicrobiota bacterium]
MNFTTRILTQFNLLLAAVLIVGLFAACNKSEPPEDYLARVNNAYLTKDDLKFLSIIDPDGKVPEAQLKGFLTDWIETEILSQQAKKHDLEDDPYLKNRLESYKKKLLADTYIRYNIYKSINITDQQIHDYYEEHKQVFMWEHDAAEVIHYFAESAVSAQQVYTILRRGTQEEQTLLYQKNHPDTKLVTSGDMIPALEEAVFGTRANGVLRPVESDVGWHVLVVNQRFKAGTYQSIDQARDKIRERLTINAQQTHYYDVLDSLKGVIDFEINKEAYNSLASEDNSRMVQ